MAKTNPIGVRFREEILNKLKTDHGIDTPQKALVFLERFYANHCELAKDITAPLRKGGEVKIKDLTKPTTDLKPHEQPRVNFSIDTTPKTSEALNSDINALQAQDLKKTILDQIAAIKAEKCPEHRNTAVGRKSWLLDQGKRIQELEKNYKNGI
jgi:hypothetical protein